MLPESDNTSTRPVRPIEITITDASAAPFKRHREPVSVGVAFPKGQVGGHTQWQLVDPQGAHLPVDTTTLDRWGDGTVRWLLVEFQADIGSNTGSVLRFGPSEGARPPQGDLVIGHDDRALVVSTGAATFHLPLSGPGFIRSVHVGDQPILQSTAIVAEDADGSHYGFLVSRATLIHTGSLRATARLEGSFVNDRGRHLLEGALQLSFYAGHGVVEAECSVTNLRAAQHPGGIWDLGDPGSVLIRDLSIEVTPAGSAPRAIATSLHAGDPMLSCAEKFSIYQDSSGGANWQHINHINRDGRVPATFRGFRAERGNQRIEGSRATPIAVVGSGVDQISIVVPRFWQMCPKKISVDRQRCVLGMFPREYGDRHEIQGGERATFRFALCFGRDTVSDTPLAWVRSPLTVAADPQSYRDAGAWAPLAVGSPAAAENYESVVETAVSGEPTFAERREVIDEYGWRNFGDLYADHEAVKGPLVSHYNNQYDALAGFISRYLQTADPRWWVLAGDLALHVADIDLYHTAGDRSAYSGGHFWHTQHYLPAGSATHRAYSRRSGSSGGGPSAEHNYTTGLMLHYFLTGAERSRAAVIQLADWVINMDDGSQSIFRWIDRGDTGLASGTRSTDFHGPGRGAGNSINALLDAHRLTNESRYLEKVDALLARCVHPNDDPGARDLLDVENRWSYTVFLQVLGKYLDYRAERGLVDAPFVHARDALMKYAVWMSANERPYLERPEQLEFPTETWAAQDLRKAAVFEWAACCTTNAIQRALFLQRAGDFFDYATSYLVASPTGRLTRPIVLLLAYGFQRPAGNAMIPEVTQAVASAGGAVFVPQRRRAVRKLALSGAALSAAALLLLLLLTS